MELTFRNRGETKIFSDERVSTCKEILKEVIKIEKKVIGKKTHFRKSITTAEIKRKQTVFIWGLFFNYNLKSNSV